MPTGSFSIVTTDWASIAMFLYPDGHPSGSINYNPGYILTPETTVGKFPNPGSGAIDRVTELQVAGPYILGNSYPPSGTEFDQWRSAQGKYFLLDTRARSMETFFTLDELRSASASKGINLSLESPIDVYSRYRRTGLTGSFLLFQLSA
jgi:hypothetical protein